MLFAFSTVGITIIALKNIIINIGTITALTLESLENPLIQHKVERISKPIENIGMFLGIPNKPSAKLSVAASIEAMIKRLNNKINTLLFLIKSNANTFFKRNNR